MAELGRLLKQQADFVAGRMRVEKVTVFSSKLQRGRPLYEVLGIARLAGEYPILWLSGSILPLTACASPALIGDK